MKLYKDLGKKFVVYQNNTNNKYKIYEVLHSWVKYDSPTVYIISSSDKEFLDDFNREAKLEWHFGRPDLEEEVEILRYTINHVYGDEDNCVFGFEVSENNVFDTLGDAEKFKEECEAGENSVRFFYCGLKKNNESIS